MDQNVNLHQCDKKFQKSLLITSREESFLSCHPFKAKADVSFLLHTVVFFTEMYLKHYLSKQRDLLTVLKVSVKMLQCFDKGVYFSCGSASNYSEFVGCVRSLYQLSAVSRGTASNYYRSSVALITSGTVLFQHNIPALFISWPFFFLFCLLF